MIIETANPETDYDAIAALLSEWRGHETTVEELLEDDALDIEGRIRRWWVARGPDGIAGAAFGARYPSEPPGRFHGYAIIVPELRGKGIGRAIYNHLDHFMRSNRAAEWHSRANEDDPVSLAFAERRGFERFYHSYESTLDLASFDDTLFSGHLEQLESEGIRFFAFDTVSADPAAQRKLYEINRLSGLDEPSSDSFASYDTWKKIVLDASWFHHDCEFVAADSDRYIGLCGAFPMAEAGVYEVGFTGVHPEYRGRKIAQALKLVSVRHAISRKAERIVTYNDSRNAAMIAINEKFGFKPRPGFFGLRKNFR